MLLYCVTLIYIISLKQKRGRDPRGLDRKGSAKYKVSKLPLKRLKRIIKGFVWDICHLPMNVQVTQA